MMPPFLCCRLACLFSVLLLLIMTPTQGYSIENPGKTLDEVGVVPRRGEAVDLSLMLTDSDGTTRSLQTAFVEGKPLILIPVYYECPRLCGLLLSGAVQLLNELSLTFGKDYRVATVSFDSDETSELAQKRALEYRGRLVVGKGDAETWPFFVGSKDAVARLMQQIGFQYLPDKGEFAHAAVLVVLTPDGRIAQYFTGISFSPRDVRLALVEAAEKKIGSVIDQVMLFCFRFDPTKGKYTWAAWNVIRFGSILSVVLIVLVIARYVRRS
jgi:protein SCO1